MTAQAVAIPINPTGNTPVAAGPSTYRGCSVRENAGVAAVATVRIWDGTSAAGTVLAAIELAANGSFAESVADGVRAGTGIFVEVVAGTVEGSVRVG